MSNHERDTGSRGAAVLISITISAEWRNELARGAVQDINLLAGNIEILIEDALLVVGAFEGALLLLPSVETLISLAEQLHAGAPRIDVELTGNGGQVTIVKRHRGPPSLYVIMTRGESGPPVRLNCFEDAVREAVVSFLHNISGLYPMKFWPEDARRLVELARATWPRAAMPA